MVRSQGPLELTVGRLAAAAGVGVETIRFYHRRGLIAQPARGGGVRRYTEHHLQRLKFIRQAQVAGFTLSEIAELLELDSGEDRARARQLAERRIEALDARIGDLKRARASLARLAKACRSTSSEPCPIIASFDGTVAEPSTRGAAVGE